MRKKQNKLLVQQIFLVWIFIAKTSGESLLYVYGLFKHLKIITIFDFSEHCFDLGSHQSSSTVRHCTDEA